MASTSSNNDEMQIGGRRGGVGDDWYSILIEEEEEETKPFVDRKAYPSQELVIQQILLSLQEPHIRTVWIRSVEHMIRETDSYVREDEPWWIIKHAVKRVTESSLFHLAIYLSQYELNSVQRTQKKISRCLRVEHDDDDDEITTAANKIQTCLQNVKLLLIFVKERDVRNTLDVLRKAGIPDTRKVNTVKLLILKNDDVDEVMAGDSVEIKATSLSNEEAWDLFHEKAGQVVLSSQIKHLAQKVMNECCGDPVIISIVAAALNNVKDKLIWERALTQLTTFYVGDIMKFSYQRIENDDQLWSCLLYCSLLFPPMFELKVTELVAYWIMEGLIDGVEHLEEKMAFHKGLAILEELLDRSLLQRVSNKHVIMVSEINNFIYKYGGVELKYNNDHAYYSPQYPEWGDAEKISWRNEGLPADSPKCPLLSTLLLVGNRLPQGIPSGFFEHMPKLGVLDLSDTLIESLPPSLSRLCSLRALLLRHCELLKRLDYAFELEKLEVLLLSECKRLSEIIDSFFNKMYALRILDLSRTPIKSLPSSLSGLNNLRHLLLKDCKFLNHVDHALVLHKLEVLLLPGCKRLSEIIDSFFNKMYGLRILDLSRTSIKSLPSSLSGLNNLRHLLLKDCKFLNHVDHALVLHKLEVLLLPGTDIKMFPYEILASNCLTHLDISDTSPNGGVEWKKVHWLPRIFKWGQCSLKSPLLYQSSEIGGVSIYVSDANFFRSLENDSPLWESSLQRFQFCVFSHKEQSRDSDVYFQAKRFPHRDVYFKAKYFVTATSHDRYLEIYSTDSFPEGVKWVLGHVGMLSLYCNEFVAQILDLGAENMMELKTYTIEGCHEIVSAFCGEKSKDGMLSSLENLWLSKLANLKSLYMGTMAQGNFMRLKYVYLDYCPILVNIFPPGLVLGCLEKLEIKFCDKLEAICEEKLGAESPFPVLQFLSLWELAELKTICRGVLPSLKMLEVRECSKLLELPLGDEIPKNSLVIRGESKWWEVLRWKDNHIKSQVKFYR